MWYNKCKGNSKNQAITLHLEGSHVSLQQRPDQSGGFQAAGWHESERKQTSVYKGYKQDKIEMRGDRAEMSDFPLYLNTVVGGLDRRDQTIGGFSFVVKIYAVPVVEIIGQLLYLLGRYGFNAQFSDCL